MIDGDTKNKLLDEIQKSGNVYLSCLKVNIGKATYYRWIKDDKNFKKAAKQAEKIGRENNCDIAEHALMLNVKDKKMDAIKYQLSHNSPIYKAKQTSNVIILHRKEEQPIVPQKSLKELIDEDEEWRKAKTETIIKKYEVMGGIPPKADGTKIELKELIGYEKYIEEWYIKKRIEGENTTT